MSEYGVISGPYFSVFSPNKGKYAPEITPYLDAFHVVFSKMFQVILDSKTNSSQAPQERVVLKNCLIKTSATGLHDQDRKMEHKLYNAQIDFKTPNSSAVQQKMLIKNINNNTNNEQIETN